MNCPEPMVTLDSGLSDREKFAVGRIVTGWATLEFVVFEQVIATYPGATGPQLSKEMSNMRFSATLDQWELRVISAASGERRVVLERELQMIRELKVPRDALVHGMLIPSNGNVRNLTSLRVRRDEFHKVEFSVEFLESFADRLDTIHFNIRYPGGVGDYAREAGGAYVSRRAMAMLSDSEWAKDWLGNRTPRAE